jgi:general secretion pathway protein A
LLTNLETAEQKLLQILLVGQPELATRLDSFELRQLKQRITLRTYLKPLDLEATRGYIRRRLHVAGAPPDGNLISDETISAVYRYSGGVARLINILCENGLVTSFARQLTSVPSEIIVQMADDLRLEAAAGPRIELGSGDDRELSQAMTTMNCSKPEILAPLHDRLPGMRAEREPYPPLEAGLQRTATPSLKPSMGS